jgi:hypothetical protein
MSTTIHDNKSRITNMDVVKGITPQLTSERISKQDGNFITSYLDTDPTSTPDQGVPLYISPTLYTTYTDNTNNTSFKPTIHDIKTPISQVSKREKDIFYKYGRKFYYFLKKPTEEKYANYRYLKGSEPNTPHSLILFLNDGTKKGYTIYNSLSDFINEYMLIPELERNFFEVIEGPQKPHFDIDALLEYFKDPSKFIPDTIAARDLVIWGINEVMHDFNVNYKPELSLIVTDSNGPNKQSYHIIIDNWYHSNHKEAEAFYNLVMNKIEDKYNPEVVIDKSVYKSVQQFRLIGSQKAGSNRSKQFIPSLTRQLNKTIYSPSDEILHSLVGFISGCELLPSFIPSEQISKPINKAQDITIAEEDQIIKLFSKLPCYSQYTRASTSNPGEIRFNRVKSGKCPYTLHTKSHDSVGCSLNVDKFGNVWFNCYSKNQPKDSYRLGSIVRDIIVQPLVTTSQEPKENISIVSDDFDPDDFDEAETETNKCVSMGGICLVHGGSNCTFVEDKEETISIQDIASKQLSNYLSRRQQRVPANDNINNHVNPISGLIARNIITNNILPKDQMGQNTHNIDTTLLSREPSTLIIPSNEPAPVSNIDSNPNITIDTFTSSQLSNYLSRQTQQQRVPAHAIINGVIPTPNPTNINYNTIGLITGHQSHNNINPKVAVGKTTATTDYYYYLMNPVTTLMSGYEPAPISNINPTDNITLSSYLNEALGTIFSFGPEYIIGTVFEGYNKYRCGKGKKYTLRGGNSESNFGTQLRSHGHIVDRKWVNGKDEIVVIFVPKVNRTLDVNVTDVKTNTINILDKPMEIKTLTTNLQPIKLTPQQEMAAALAKDNQRPRLLFKTYDDRWNDSNIPKLRGPHEQDRSPILRKIRTIVNGDKFFLIMKAVCGMGKTVEIVEELGFNKDASVLVVCGKRTLGRKQLDDLEKQGFVYYENLGKGLLKNNKKLIVQIDSLWRVIGKYEYLILDEFTYSENQVVIFTKNKKQCIDALIHRIKTTPKVIVADAFIDDNTVDLFRMMRDDITIYENIYPKQENKTVYMVTSHGKFISMIYESIRQGKKLIIPCGSKDDVNTLYKEIVEMGQSIRIKTYTSDKVIDIDPTTEWIDYDIIIFTSVCEAGNSFVHPHFHRCFGYFTPMSFPPESAAQMVLRSRQLIDGEIYIYVGPNKKPQFPINVNDIATMKVHLQTDDMVARTDLLSVITMSYDDGRIDVMHPYFHWVADVKLRQHLGMMNYEDRLMALLKSQGMRFGGVINDKDNYEKKINKEISNGYREIKKDVRYQDDKSIAEASELTFTEAVQISNDEKASKQDRDALKKYHLMSRYELETITPEFVEHNKDKTQIHRNIQACSELSIECDENEKLRIMTEVQNKMFEGEGVEIDGKKSIQHITERIRNTDKMLNYKRCMYLINIMRILGQPKFLEDGYIIRENYQKGYGIIEQHYPMLEATNFSDIIKLYYSQFGIKLIDLDAFRKSKKKMAHISENSPIRDVRNVILVENSYKKLEDRHLYVPINMFGATIKPKAAKYVTMTNTKMMLSDTDWYEKKEEDN